MSARHRHKAGPRHWLTIPPALVLTCLFAMPQSFAQADNVDPGLQLEVEVAPGLELPESPRQATTEAVAKAPVEAEPTPEPMPVADEIEALKQRLLELNRDLLILEEELLYPANNQIALYLSVDVGEYFQLDSVKVHIDDHLVASELYTDHQVDALLRGGVQRLYVGNLKTGDHQLTAFFIGIGPEGREYKRAAEISIDKQTSGKVYELKIIDSSAKQQPVFDIKEWQL